MTRVWGVFAAACGVMVMFELTGTVGRVPAPVEGGALFVAGLVLAVSGWRGAAFSVAVGGFVAWVGPHPATLLVFLVWGSLALALFDGAELRTALTVQAGVCYLFAAANKVFAPFWSGRVLAGIVPWMPGVRVVAMSVVLIEAGLGVLVLVRSRWAPLAVVVFHTPLVVLSARDATHAGALALYALMMLWAVVRGQEEHSRVARGPGASGEHPGEGCRQGAAEKGWSDSQVVERVS